MHTEADNVLKPGAPRFLWRLCKSSDFETEAQNGTYADFRVPWLWADA